MLWEAAASLAWAERLELLNDDSTGPLRDRRQIFALSVSTDTRVEKVKPFLGVKGQMQSKQLQLRLKSKGKPAALNLHLHEVTSFSNIFLISNQPSFICKQDSNLLYSYFRPCSSNTMTPQKDRIWFFLVKWHSPETHFLIRFYFLAFAIIQVWQTCII